MGRSTRKWEAMMDRKRSVKWLTRQFIDRLVMHLRRDAGIHTHTLCGHSRVVWREPGTKIGILNVGTFTESSLMESMASMEPLVARVEINSDFRCIDRPAFKLLDVPRSVADGSDPAHIESGMTLNCLRDELVSLANWVACWIIRRQELHGGTAPEEIYTEARRALAMPPVPFEDLITSLGSLDDPLLLWSDRAVKEYGRHVILSEEWKMIARSRTTTTPLSPC
jgi:hypothetical protein